MIASRRTVLKSTLAVAVAAPFIRTGNAAAALRLRISSSLTDDANSSHFLWFDRFRSTLAASVGDAVTLNYFPNNQLGKESDIVQQVKIGAVDMMISGSSIWATVAPEIGVLDLGYLFADAGHVGRALDGTAGQTLSGILAQRASVRILGYAYSLGARNVYTRPALTPEGGLKGIKIRVLPVPNFIATLEAMGAVATPIPLGEVYAALQTGVVDGLEQDAPTVLAGKFYEVAKHCYRTRHIFNPVIPVISNRAFDRLPADIRTAVQAAAKAATDHQRAQAAETEARAFADLQGRGVTVTDVDTGAYRAAVEPVWARFVAQQPATAPVIDAVRASA
ncbi:TRAP transporter substrate-binding protein [Azospirillum doebereinerae]|uniref:TRAP transporter substrate-binding protein n=1 Tax=Azospirillum doebereinerae TaxID=92933 RepID=UPI001EE610A0|nr:TRAP transporter substrate-binding protein [Azospirillum doebereinerae]MCG5238305.1 TRAP transporter substrate-binding protein [Azospirillum doebereinerae]